MKNKKNETPDWLKGYLENEDSENKFHKGALKKIFREIFHFKVLFFSGAFFTVATTVFFLIQPKIIALIIDDVIVKKDLSALKLFIVFFISVELLRVLSVFFQEYLFNLLGQKVMLHLRMKVFSHIQKLPISVFDKTPAGKLVTRVTNDIASLADMFTSGFISILGNIILIAGLIGALFLVHAKIALLTMCVFPFVILFSIYFTNKLKIAYRDARSKLSALNAFLAENISGMKIVHIFNRQKEHLSRFQEINDWYTRAQISSIKVFSLFHPTITVFTGISMGIAIWYGGHAVLAGVLTVGSFTMITSYIVSAFKPLRDISDRWNLFLSGMASAERLFSILEWKTESDLIFKDEEVLPDSSIKGDVEFQDVWFAYNEDFWILKGISFKVSAGQFMGIVGPTGSGKTTLIQLLLRFYDPQKGRILLDGKDIRLWDKRKLRVSFGLIQQDVFLFSGSIEENILLWRGKNALKSFNHFGDFPEIQSELKKDIQERGVNLSLGQRQVISFLRTASHNPSLWILDEASSNIDSDSEEKLEKLFREHSKLKTSFVIAHRLSSVKNADQILVLSLGKIVEKGTHSELIKNKGLYYKLYSYQQNVDEVGFFG